MSLPELGSRGCAEGSNHRGVAVVSDRCGKLSDSANLDSLPVAVKKGVKYISSNHVERAWRAGRMVELGVGGAVAGELSSMVGGKITRNLQIPT